MKSLTNSIFEIKYEIFEDDLDELKVIDLRTFDIEFHQIYGTFTLVVDGQELFPYPSSEMPLSAKRIFSELILTHFELLIQVHDALKTHDYVALKYVENPWTWLEIKVDGEQYILSELKYDISPLKSLVCTDRNQLKDALRNSISNVRIAKKEFESELKRNLRKFVHEIENINISLLKSQYLSKVLQFYQEHN